MPSVPLDPEAVSRLCKLLGMLRSAHAGERAAFGAKAHEFIKRRGLTWRDVIRVPIADHSNFYGVETETEEEEWEPIRKFCLQRARLLTLKERGFLINIGDWNGPLTERQQVWLNNIYARLRREAA